MSGAVRYHDQQAATWEGRYDSASFKSRIATLLSLLEGVDLDGRQWLDLGCGTGTLARILAERGASVLGVDASSTMIAEARSLSPESQALRFEQIATAEDLAPLDGPFDGVLCSSLLEYLEHPRACLKECHRVLEPGGRLILSVPNRGSLLRRTQGLSFALTRTLNLRPRPAYLIHSRHAYRRHELHRLLIELGFDPLEVECFGSPLWPVLDRLSAFGSLWMTLARKQP